jgi:hypothetical protein
MATRKVVSSQESSATLQIRLPPLIIDKSIINTKSKRSPGIFILADFSAC